MGSLEHLPKLILERLGLSPLVDGNKVSITMPDGFCLSVDVRDDLLHEYSPFTYLILCVIKLYPSLLDFREVYFYDSEKGDHKMSKEDCVEVLHNFPYVLVREGKS